MGRLTILTIDILGVSSVSFAYDQNEIPVMSKLAAKPTLKVAKELHFGFL